MNQFRCGRSRHGVLGGAFDALGVPLELSTVVFGVLLAGAFGAW
jgi:hypothetical protein